MGTMSLLTYLFLCGADRTQCLTAARQALNHWAITLAQDKDFFLLALSDNKMTKANDLIRGVLTGNHTGELLLHLRAWVVLYGQSSLVL